MSHPWYLPEEVKIKGSRSMEDEGCQHQGQMHRPFGLGMGSLVLPKYNKGGREDLHNSCWSLQD